ncbi:UNVERIFIED_CONTAM: hypothetical protein GTU68_056981, partial [Idotea baltica]|nr:hypothetical protein [Idotea baltica]
GFLGINGAGKSTLLNIIATSFKPTEGTYHFDDINCVKNPIALRKQLGYLPQHCGFIPELSVKDYLSYLSLLKGCDHTYLKKAIPHYLECFNLQDKIKEPISRLSGGMKQRIGIIQAIITKPKILILDEPIIGLDPNERKNFNSIISGLSNNTIVLISSHIIEDIENLCENVVLMNEGQVIFNGATEAILASMNGKVHEKMISRLAFEQMSDKSKIIRIKPMGASLNIRYISENKEGAHPVYPSLEDAFIYKTKIAI